jgi:ATP-dependent DNA helicase RecQ
LFIADFIKELSQENITVSCFTATAKKQVKDDIKEYFKKNLAKEFIEIQAPNQRDNLSYMKITVPRKDKESILLSLIDDNPTIVFTNTTTQAEELANHLNDE